MKLYEGSKHYDSKANLCEAVKTTTLEIECTEVKKKKTSKSKNNRLLAFMEK